MADPSVDILAIANDAVRIGSYVAFYSTEVRAPAIRSSSARQAVSRSPGLLGCRRASSARHAPQNAGFVYSDNPVRANVVIHPVASPETPDLPNIKGSVFEVTHAERRAQHRTELRT